MTREIMKQALAEMRADMRSRVGKKILSISISRGDEGEEEKKKKKKEKEPEEAEEKAEQKPHPIFGV